MGPALEPTLTLVLLEALSAAVPDSPYELSVDAVGITLDGVELVITVASPPDHETYDSLDTLSANPAGGDEAVRTTLRLPARLRDAIVDRAKCGGLSANAWTLRSLARMLQTNSTASTRCDRPHTSHIRTPMPSLGRADSGLSPSAARVTEWPSHWHRATLGLVVLRSLEAGPSYGYAITATLADAGLGQIKEGTLYPLLTRLEDSGLVRAEWRPSGVGPERKYFSLTHDGRKALRETAAGLDTFL